MRLTPWLAGLAACAMPEIVAGQVIQLPSFHSFSVDTTVVVPDAGRATIAGNRQGRTGVSRVGPHSANRSVGVDRQATGASALAAIHDPRQADAALRRRAKNNVGPRRRLRSKCGALGWPHTRLGPAAAKR